MHPFCCVIRILRRKGVFFFDLCFALEASLVASSRRGRRIFAHVDHGITAIRLLRSVAIHLGRCSGAVRTKVMQLSGRALVARHRRSHHTLRHQRYIRGAWGDNIAPVLTSSM